ncbi:TetR family transcriptional regulator [Lysinibacillus sp. NPDC048646]|uniref:TetR/AcrR family transcriptional regulator n=1 Tax=Lysinibacillus sp. NPDC048646 TaxID=3390574 RepID=UPI003CFDBAB7
MSTKASAKRALIIRTAIHYLQENDLSTLTLEKVAGKAGVSKGGLLYHFKTKDVLHAAIAESIMAEFIESYEKRAQQEHGVGRLTRGFILASQQDLAEGAWFNIAIQIIQNEHTSISTAYEQILEDLLHDDLETSIVHLIRLTIDGLYYSKLLNIAPVSKEVTEMVFAQLLQMTRKDEFS